MGPRPSTHPPHSPPIKGFDLNSFVYEARVCCSINDNYKKRSFAQAFNDSEHDKTSSTTSATAVPQTPPLLLRNKQPNSNSTPDPNAEVVSLSPKTLLYPNARNEDLRYEVRNGEAVKKVSPVSLITVMECHPRLSIKAPNGEDAIKFYVAVLGAVELKHETDLKREAD
ncbi:hypothetical protein FF1_000847 [Malus domestica]